MKIGRNAPCPCGSGAKYKRCCGSFANATQSSMATSVTAKSIIRRMEAAEQLRQKAQGYGRPIMSTMVKDTRLVVVGQQIYYSKTWRFFPDFLLFYVKEIFGQTWFADELAKKNRHPICDWHDCLISELRSNRKGGETSELTSNHSLLFLKLSYALYLINHNDQLPMLLLKRLKSAEQFMDAVNETFAAAAFVITGFKIQMLEEKATDLPQAEFLATDPISGEQFSIEAKRRGAWKKLEYENGQEFEKELETWISRKTRDCNNKQLANPIYWFDLALPFQISDAQAYDVYHAVVRALRDAEKRIAERGPEATPAFVYVTSQSVENRLDSASKFALVDGVNRLFHQVGTLVNINEMLDAYDQQRPIIRVMKAMEKIEAIPQSFDSIPAGLMDEKGMPIATPKIGERTSIDVEGGTKYGIIEELVSVRDELIMLVRSEDDGKVSICRHKLDARLAEAAKQFGDAIFGKSVSENTHIPEGDYMSLYDFFLDGYATTQRKKLIELIGAAISQSQINAMSDDELRRFYCRRLVASFAAKSQKN